MTCHKYRAFLDDYNNNMIIYLRCAKTLTWVFCPFRVGVGTCGIGVQTMKQFKQPDKLVYKRC